MNLPYISTSEPFQGNSANYDRDSPISDREASSINSEPSGSTIQSESHDDLEVPPKKNSFSYDYTTPLVGRESREGVSHRGAKAFDQRKHFGSGADTYDALRERSQNGISTHRGPNLATSLGSRFMPLHYAGRGAPVVRLFANSDAVSDHSDDTVTPAKNDSSPLQPIGKWRCCKCERGHDIYNFTKGAHPVSILNCVCTHRSCVNCTLDGLIKRFEPMNEVEVVQLSEDGLKQVRFGVFCDACGLSWRAQEVEEEQSRKSPLQRISALPKRLKKRGPHPLEKLRYSQSMSNLSCPRSLRHPFPVSKSTLNLRELSNEMEKGHGKQAEFATVKFTGIQCTCGFLTEVRCLCFQVVDPPRDYHEATFVKLVADRKVAAFTSTLEDQARGHDTPMLKLKGGPHANPLMSNPIKKEDLIE